MLPEKAGAIVNIELTVPNAKRVTLVLLAVVFTLIALSTIGQVSKHVLGHPQLKGFVPAFYVDLESSVPTWYSSAALGFAGLLLALIAVYAWSARDPYRLHWSALAALFVLLSIDEIAMFHELPIDGLRESLGAGGVLYYTWVIPGAVFVLVVGAAFARFLWHLPRRTRVTFVVAGIVFVGGAIGVEMISGLQADRYGEQTLGYAMIVTVEELCEMLGIVIFIHGLLDYIASRAGEIRIRIGNSRAPNAA